MKQRAFALGMVVVLSACGGGEPPARAPGDVEAENTPPASSGGSSADGEIDKGTAAIKAGDWNAARAAFESALAKDPKKAEAHYYLGLVLDKAGDRTAAATHYEQALAISPNLSEAATNLIAIDVEARKFDDAIVLAKKVLAKDDKNAEIQLNLATALSGKGDVDEASKAFEKAVALAPNDARFYMAFAKHLEGAKKSDQAVERLKQAERVAGDDPALLGSIGFSFRTARAVPECIAAFDRAIALKDNADFRTNRALCKYAAKDKTGAVADLKAATTAEPAFAPAHYWLGSWLHDDGKFAEAVAEYDAYLKAAPDGPMAKAAEGKSKLAKEKKKPVPPPKR